MGAIVLLREKVLRPIVDRFCGYVLIVDSRQDAEIDQHYQAVRQNILTLLNDLRTAA